MKELWHKSAGTNSEKGNEAGYEVYVERAYFGYISFPIWRLLGIATEDFRTVEKQTNTPNIYNILQLVTTRPCTLDLLFSVYTHPLLYS